MFDRALDRTLTYRLSAAYDCWGHRRALRCGSRNGLWFLDAGAFDSPEPDDGNGARPPQREHILALFAASRRFTPIELATLRALVAERLSLEEIAARDGCSRQAIVARLTGNSRGQGGILKKARALLAELAHGETCRKP